MPVLVRWSLLVAMGVSSVSPSSGGLQFPIRIIDTPAVLRIHSNLFVSELSAVHQDLVCSWTKAGVILVLKLDIYCV